MQQLRTRKKTKRATPLQPDPKSTAMIPICVAAFAAHPDDVELSASGTLLGMKAEGHRIGIINLTRGELGTRGTPEIRAKEADHAAEILGLDFHLNLGLPDGGLLNTLEQRLKIIQAIRTVKPDVILCNAIDDRHPDHGNAAILVREAAFLAGLKNIVTIDSNGNEQAAHRPRQVLHYIQDRFIKPDIVIDITAFWDTRMESVRAFKSQFYDPSSTEPITHISTPEFFEGVIARSKEIGKMIGVLYGEGFTMSRPPGLKSLADLL